MRNDIAIVLGAALLVVLMSGCMSESAKNEVADENESENVRYVEIYLLDGSRTGGKYVSETAAFTTLISMYVVHPDAYTYDAYYKRVKNPTEYFKRGSGAEVSIKNSLINTMVTIDDPMAMIEANLQEMNETAEAIKKAEERKAEEYVMAKEKREASV